MTEDEAVDFATGADASEEDAAVVLRVADTPQWESFVSAVEQTRAPFIEIEKALVHDAVPLDYWLSAYRPALPPLEDADWSERAKYELVGHWYDSVTHVYATHFDPRSDMWFGWSARMDMVEFAEWGVFPNQQLRELGRGALFDERPKVVDVLPPLAWDDASEDFDGWTPHF